MPGDLDVEHAPVGDIDLAYSTMGDRGAPPVLLITGLGGQLISWDEGFCRELVGRGLYVIRFDHRDVGLSTHLTGPPPALTPATNPFAVRPAYTLSDMAADVSGLIAQLDLGPVHLVGVSMGGMIAQILTIEHPEQVRSLTSIMSTTGDNGVGQPTQAAIAMLTAPPPATREDVRATAVPTGRAMGSPAYPTPDDVLRDRAVAAFDRAFNPAGLVRQLHAVAITPDRTEALRAVGVPTLVIHGAADPLVNVSGGQATAAAVPGAELVVIDGMGHDLPEPLWPALADHIAGLIARAERVTAAAD